jgi:hypothetical protein
VAEFDGLDGRVLAPLPFGQRLEETPHGRFDVRRVSFYHRSALSCLLATPRASRIVVEKSRARKTKPGS